MKDFTGCYHGGQEGHSRTANPRTGQKGCETVATLIKKHMPMHGCIQVSAYTLMQRNHIGPTITQSIKAVNYIEMFYNPKRKHARNGMLSPLEFERQQKLRHEGV